MAHIIRPLWINWDFNCTNRQSNVHKFNVIFHFNLKSPNFINSNHRMVIILVQIYELHPFI